MHRDIASRNILLTEKLVPKISDFGLARKLDVTRHYIVNNNVCYIFACFHDRVGIIYIVLDYFLRTLQKMLPVKWMSIESLLYGRFTSESER